MLQTQEEIPQDRPAAFNSLRGTEALRLLRAMHMLENTGAEGHRLLRELANGAEEAWLTRQAQAALARLHRRAP